MFSLRAGLRRVTLIDMRVILVAVLVSSCGSEFSQSSSMSSGGVTAEIPQSNGGTEVVGVSAQRQISGGSQALESIGGRYDSGGATSSGGSSFGGLRPMPVATGGTGGSVTGGAASYGGFGGGSLLPRCDCTLRNCLALTSCELECAFARCACDPNVPDCQKVFECYLANACRATDPCATNSDGKCGMNVLAVGTAAVKSAAAVYACHCG